MNPPEFRHVRERDADCRGGMARVTYRNGKLHKKVCTVRENGETLMRKTSYNGDGNVDRVTFYSTDGKIHRSGDQPARVLYLPNGVITWEFWAINGERHRVGGPAEVRYLDDGEVIHSTWYTNNVQYNPDGGPSNVLNYGVLIRKTWTNPEGEVHRLDGPAVLELDANDENIVIEETYYIDGTEYATREEFVAAGGTLPEDPAEKAHLEAVEAATEEAKRAHELAGCGDNDDELRVLMPPYELLKDIYDCDTLDSGMLCCKPLACNICFEIMGTVGVVKACKNGHKFHKRCITAWKQTGNNNCPVCREGLEV